MSITRRYVSSLFHLNKSFTAIAHITDTEGTDYFFTAVKKSKILTLNAATGLNFKNIKQTPFFIFGGDATDRGSHDLETVEMLVDFKKRNPANVALLVGNREIKNNRFKIELASDLIHERLLTGKAARWLPPQQQITPYGYLKSLTSIVDDAAMLEYVKTLSNSAAQLIYLRWMLENNMGCQQTFAYRKVELQRRAAGQVISDHDVLQSFINATLPTGVMGEYLKLGQMGVIVPRTRVLAVHGGITPFNMGRVPDDTTFYANAKTWITQLNAWYAKQIQNWSQATPNTVTEPAISSLDSAVLPIANKPKQVVTADMLSVDRQFLAISNQVSDYLMSNQLSIVLTGHQPCGDYPAIVRNQQDNLVFVNADTGYANFNPTKLTDTRGDARHSIEIFGNEDMSTLKINAQIADGHTADTQLFIRADSISGDAHVGKILSDNSLVQCKLPNGDYRLVKQKGFAVSYRIINPLELLALSNGGTRSQLTCN